MRRGIAVTLALSLAALGLLGAAKPGDVRLLMVEQQGCRFCMKWNVEVGKVYASTREGKLAPLTRIERSDDLLRSYAPVVYTPTFILTSAGEEVGRIAGYPGEIYFWEELNELLAGAGLDSETRRAHEP